MKNVIIFFLGLLTISCDGDCHNEVIQTAKWITITKSVQRDTILNYSLVYHDSRYNSSDKTITETFVIKNESGYNGDFGISFDFGIVFNYNETRNYWSGYENIEPKSTHTFSFERQANYYHNFNSNFKVKTLSKTVYVDVQEDYLKLKDTTVNSCKCNVLAEIAKNESVKKVFSEKVKNDSVASQNHKSMMKSKMEKMEKNKTNSKN